MLYYYYDFVQVMPCFVWYIVICVMEQYAVRGQLYWEGISYMK